MAFSSRACMAETSWRRSPTTAMGGDGSCRTISMPRWSAVARTRSMASAMTRLTRTGSRDGASSDSIRERSSRSSMIRLTRKASLWIRPARRWATSASGSATSVSASRPSAPMGVLSSWLTLATKSRRISSSRRRSETSSMSAMTPRGRRPSSIWRARTCNVRRGRPVQIERALRRTFVPGALEQLGHRLRRQRVAVPAHHERIGPPVAVDHGAVLVAEDDALRQRIEGAPEADGVRARFGHRLRRPTGDLLEVGEGGLDVRLVLGWVEAQSRPECGEPLGDGPSPRAPPQPGGHGDGDDEEDDRGDHDDHTTGGAQRKQFLATDHDPQYDSPGRALVHKPGSAGPTVLCKTLKGHETVLR